MGQVRPEAVWQALGKRDMVVRRVGADFLCTSVNVLAEEVSLINFVRTGRDQHAPLASRHFKLGNPKLSAEQQTAVRHILGSQDQVIGLRGGAGVGKTTSMQEVVAQIQASGQRVFAFAPSASASRDTLREAGLADAETVAHHPGLDGERRCLDDSDLPCGEG